MAELDLSRAIRRELARHLHTAPAARISYAVPQGVSVELADPAAAHSVVADLVSRLVAAPPPAGPSVLSVDRASARTVVLALR